MQFFLCEEKPVVPADFCLLLPRLRAITLTEFAARRIVNHGG
jgi:hypothetical protein